MNATIQKWGNSLAVRLPRALANEAHITAGVQVELVPTKEGLLIKRTRRQRYSLAKLVAGITPENLHPETDW
jgi:antitoxin MazE